jgi:hypothetical protein
MIPGRFYTCPTCQAYVEKPPVKISLLTEMVSKITGLLEPDIERSERTVLANAHWGVFFEQ